MNALMVFTSMRDAIVSDWVASSAWSSWKRDTIAGDASARRYQRLTRGRDSVILMDAPPETCGSQLQFVQIANHLRGLGLAAPDVLEWDEGLGVMVLEDLGDVDFARHLRHAPQDERMLYINAAETLVILRQSIIPDGLDAMTPAVGSDMIDLAFDWAANDASHSLANDIKQTLRAMLNEVDPNPSCLSLRDFHAENLIWRPEQAGVGRVGLLDFQDAFVTHPSYDLASMLRDARRDVDPSMLEILLNVIANDKSDRSLYRHAFHVMAIQRNLRILGIFNRLARRDGKTGYLALLPRVWGYLQADLAAPVARDLAPLIRRAFTAPKVRS